MTHIDKINPIISGVLAILLGLVGFFAQNNYQQIKDANKLLFEKINNLRDTQEKSAMDYEKRLALIEYILSTNNQSKHGR